MATYMRLSEACPAGAPTCNDVTAVSVLLPLFRDRGGAMRAVKYGTPSGDTIYTA